MAFKVYIHNDGLGTPTSFKGYAPGLSQVATGPTETYVIGHLKEMVKIQINWLKAIDFKEVQYVDSEGNNLQE